jgi:hypothetical protein
MAGRADRGEGGFGGEPGARGNVEDAHTWRKVRCAQQEGHEVHRNVRESTVVFRRRILEGELLRHPQSCSCLGREATFSTIRWLRARSANCRARAGMDSVMSEKGQNCSPDSRTGNDRFR